MIAQYLTCCYTYILYSYMRIPLSRSYRSRRGVRHLSHLLRGAGQGPRRGSSGSVSIHSIMHMSYYITLPYSYSICLSISNTILHEYVYAIYAIYYIYIACRRPSRRCPRRYTSTAWSPRRRPANFMVSIV